MALTLCCRGDKPCETIGPVTSELTGKGRQQTAIQKVESRKSTEERGCGWAELIAAGVHFYLLLSNCFANLVQSQTAVQKVESRKSTEERGGGWAGLIAAGVHFLLSVCFATLVQSQTAVQKVESRKSTEERGCGWAESIVAGSTFYFPLSPL